MNKWKKCSEVFQTAKQNSGCATPAAQGEPDVMSEKPVKKMIRQRAVMVGTEAGFVGRKLNMSKNGGRKTPVR